MRFDRLWLETVGSEAWASLGIAIVGVCGGVLGAFVTGWLTRRKTSAEAGQAIATGADEVVGSALSMVKEMRTDVETLKCRVSELETENRRLREMVEQQGKIIEEQGRVIEEQGRTIAKLEQERTQLTEEVERLMVER